MRRLTIAAGVTAAAFVVAAIVLHPWTNGVGERSASTASPTAGATSGAETAPRTAWSQPSVAVPDSSFVRGLAEIGTSLYAWGEKEDGDAAIWVSRDGSTWAEAEVQSAKHGYAWISGISELHGRLYAWGKAGQWKVAYWQPGIWVSEDGLHWTFTDFPEVHIRYADVAQIIDAGDRLVALTTSGIKWLDDSATRPTATAIYVSSDGISWEPVSDVPPPNGGSHQILIRVGERLLAIGTDVWASRDGGRSWKVTTPHQYLGGRMLAVASQGSIVVGLGRYDDCNGWTCSWPDYLWLSHDGGTTWQRRSGPVGDTVTFGDSGRIVMMRGSSPPLLAWISDDHGVTWRKSKPRTSVYHYNGNMAVVPGGYVASGYPEDEDASIILTSPDGRQWADHRVDFRVDRILWSPTLGLVAAGACARPAAGLCVRLGPDPFP